MYVRGSSSADEYRRNDTFFYKGIVVDDNDPQENLRLKIFIPEISNQPLDDWLNIGDQKIMNFPGYYDALTPDVLEEIKKGLPWAEPALPLIGEFGPGRYFGEQGKGTMKDGNFISQDSDPPSKAQQEGKNSDENTKNDNTTLNNAYGDNYAANAYPNAPKGAYGLPSIGSKIWVFHYGGDLNFPVYFAGRSSSNEVAPIFASGNGRPGGGYASSDLPNGSGSRGGSMDLEQFPPDSTYDGELLAEGSQTRVDPKKLYAYTRDKVANSSLNGFVPKDGAKYGIRKGTPDEWARYFTYLAKLESSYRTTTVGDVGRFVGNSNGLFQLSPKDATNYRFQKRPYTISQLRDPEFNTDAAIKIHEHWMRRDGVISGRASNGAVRGAARYWGPLRTGRAWDRKIGNLS